MPLSLRILDEIDGEEAFADAAFAVKDENQSFHCVCRVEFADLGDARAALNGLSDVSPPSEFGGGSAGVPDSPAGVESVVAVPPFGSAPKTGGRFRAGRLRGRIFSPRT